LRFAEDEMPIYEYQCQACHKISEAMQKINEAPLADCELCGAKGSLHRLISKNSFVLKGTGWYVTDFRDGKKGSDTPSSPGHDEAAHGAAPEHAAADAAPKPESAPEKKAESTEKKAETPKSGPSKAAAPQA